MIDFSKLLPPYTPKVWKIIFYCVIGLTLLGLILFGIDRCSTWNQNRKLNNAKQEVNVALQELANAKAAVDPHAESAAIEKLKEATNTAIEATTATDEAKAETNAALANYKAARNANRPTGTTEAELLKAIEDLP